MHSEILFVRRGSAAQAENPGSQLRSRHEFRGRKSNGFPAFAPAELVIMRLGTHSL